MPNRYWVGGTASWDGTAGTKWAATSNGTGGETVPTTADDVFFDTSSTGTVTIATGNTGAKSITCTGFTGTITGTASITVAGSVTLVAGMTYSHTGAVIFTGTATLTTAGKTFSSVTIDGSGITLTLGDALNASGRTVAITRGTFDTANYAVSAGELSSSNSNIRTITLGSSTVTLSNLGTSLNFGTATNLTFNANTSQINLTQSSSTLSGGSQTFYNVSFTNGTVGTRSITGTNIFNNLNITASATGLSQLSLSANQTVNGTFTCAGNSAIARGFIRSDTIGTPRTITAAAISANDCDFRDITLAGAASGASPTRAGNCGGNSGITFPTAKTVYRVGTATSWNSADSWATVTNGTGATNNFPLPQDTAIINNDTALTGTLSFGSTQNIGTLDCSQRSTGITINYGNTNNFYGSYILGSGITIAGTNGQTFSGRGTMNFTSAGKTITFPITVDAPASTLKLLDAINVDNFIVLTRGTLDANGYSVTATQFSSNTSQTRTLMMGSGLWTLTGAGTPWSISTQSGLTFNKGTANILITHNFTDSQNFGGAGLAYNKLTLGGSGSTTFAFTGSINNTSFTEFDSIKTVAHTIEFGGSAQFGTIDTWSVKGTPGNLVTLRATVAGSRRTFTLTNVTSGINYLNVKDIGELSGDKFYVGTNSTDAGNNSNVYFTNAPSTVATGNMLMLF